MPFTVLFAALLLIQAHPIELHDGPELTAVIAARDAELFHVMFDLCDPGALSDLVTADLEFYHDRGGLTATGATFVTEYGERCAGPQGSGTFHSRRELVPESLRVYAIPGIGAVEEGSHLFYERQGDGPEHLVGRARFSVLWRLEEGQWRLARAFSIDHAAVD